jgi:hypothetical protein
MQLCISPDGQQVRAGLIFKGKNRGPATNSAWKIGTKPRGAPNGTECESELWDKRVWVRFQECAWADPEYSRDWIDNCFCVDIDSMEGGTEEETILFADNLGGQKEPQGPFKEIAHVLGNCLVWNLPKNCTDGVRPPKVVECH